MVLGIEIAVDGLHQVGSILVRLVDAAFQREGFYGVNVRVADDVLEVPLHRVYPTFAVEVSLNGADGIGVRICDVIIADGAFKDGSCEFCKSHIHLTI